mgnify:CR=1 FL=1
MIKPSGDDSFELFDLRVEWEGDGPCWCKAKAGDHFELHGEQLHFPPGQSWSIYTLAALLPILPAKQRPCHPNDWMSTDARAVCALAMPVMALVTPGPAVTSATPICPVSSEWAWAM